MYIYIYILVLPMYDSYINDKLISNIVATVVIG